MGQTQEILEIVQFLKDNMASKQDLLEVKERVINLEHSVGMIERDQRHIWQSMDQMKSDITSQFEKFSKKLNIKLT